MKRTKEIQWKWHAPAGIITLALVLLLAVFADGFSSVSHAESAAKVTASSAKIRKEANSGSAVVGSTEKDKVISIKSQVTGSDGYTWYEVYVDANTLGYIRSDLVTITDGSTPPTGTAATAAATAAPAAAATATPAPAVNETPVEVTAVNPVSATVTGGESVRIRSNASTTSQIVTTVKNGMALTITGTATGTDSKTWYQVTFISNGTEVTGFIRSDYANVTEELVPAGTETPAADTPSDTPQEEEPSQQEETKEYDTILQDDVWYVVNNTTGDGYVLQDLFDGVTKNATLYEESAKTVKTQKVIIIVLVVLLVGAVIAATLLIFKLKDIEDAEYFNEVERETLRKRDNGRTQGQRPTQQGARPAAQGQRPAQQGTRPTAQGQRPAQQGVRPTAQGQRPTQQGTRPAAQGQRPVQQGTRPTAQGQRPVQQGTRPTAQGQRPVQQGARPVTQGQRPVQQGARPATQGQRPVQQEARPAAPRNSQQASGWQAKNFMTDDDEFEFEFLNYDGDGDDMQ